MFESADINQYIYRYPSSAVQPSRRCVTDYIYSRIGCYLYVCSMFAPCLHYQSPSYVCDYGRVSAPAFPALRRLSSLFLGHRLTSSSTLMTYNSCNCPSYVCRPRLRSNVLSLIGWTAVDMRCWGPPSVPTATIHKIGRAASLMSYVVMVTLYWLNEFFIICRSCVAWLSHCGPKEEAPCR